LRYWLIAHKHFLPIGGSTRASLNIGALRKIKIPLPPLPEQKRIAAILDQADALRRQRQAALDRLNTLGQSIFYDMFGDASLWNNEQKVSDIAELINGDRSSKYPSGDDIVKQGVLFLSSKNIQNSNLILDNCNYISQEKFNSLSRGKLQRKDLVVTLRGSIGQCAEFDCHYETGFINAQMMIVRPNQNLVTSKYFRDFFTHPRTQSGFLRNKSGSAIPQLTGKQISELKIPVPDIALQFKYEKRLEQIGTQRKKHKEAKIKTENLFSSLQQRAFRGEL